MAAVQEKDEKKHDRKKGDDTKSDGTVSSGLPPSQGYHVGEEDDRTANFRHDIFGQNIGTMTETTQSPEWRNHQVRQGLTTVDLPDDPVATGAIATHTEQRLTRVLQGDTPEPTLRFSRLLRGRKHPVATEDVVACRQLIQDVAPVILEITNRRLQEQCEDARTDGLAAATNLEQRNASPVVFSVAPVALEGGLINVREARVAVVSPTGDIVDQIRAVAQGFVFNNGICRYQVDGRGRPVQVSAGISQRNKFGQFSGDALERGIVAVEALETTRAALSMLPIGQQQAVEACLTARQEAFEAIWRQTVDTTTPALQNVLERYRLTYSNNFIQDMSLLLRFNQRNDGFELPTEVLLSVAFENIWARIMGVHMVPLPSFMPGVEEDEQEKSLRLFNRVYVSYEAQRLGHAIFNVGRIDRPEIALNTLNQAAGGVFWAHEAFMYRTADGLYHEADDVIATTLDGMLRYEDHLLARFEEQVVVRLADHGGLNQLERALIDETLFGDQIPIRQLITVLGSVAADALMGVFQQTNYVASFGSDEGQEGRDIEDTLSTNWRAQYGEAITAVRNELAKQIEALQGKSSMYPNSLTTQQLALSTFISGILEAMRGGIWNAQPVVDDMVNMGSRLIDPKKLKIVAAVVNSAMAETIGSLVSVRLPFIFAQEQPPFSSGQVVQTREAALSTLRRMRPTMTAVNIETDRLIGAVVTYVQAATQSPTGVYAQSVDHAATILAQRAAAAGFNQLEIAYFIQFARNLAERMVLNN